MDAIFHGINEAGGVDVTFSQTAIPDAKYYSLTIGISHDIQLKQIPGKGKRHITMRTSDIRRPNGATETTSETGKATTGPLYDNITMTVWCTTQDRHEECLRMAKVGGPFEVTWAFEKMTLYITHAEYSQEPGLYEPPDTFYYNQTADGGLEGKEGHTCKWVFNLREFNKGV